MILPNIKHLRMDTHHPKSQDFVRVLWDELSSVSSQDNFLYIASGEGFPGYGLGQGDPSAVVNYKIGPFSTDPKKKKKKQNKLQGLISSILSFTSSMGADCAHITLLCRFEDEYMLHHYTMDSDNDVFSIHEVTDPPTLFELAIRHGSPAVDIVVRASKSDHDSDYDYDDDCSMQCFYNDDDEEEKEKGKGKEENAEKVCWTKMLERGVRALAEEKGKTFQVVKELNRDIGLTLEFVAECICYSNIVLIHGEEICDFFSFFYYHQIASGEALYLDPAGHVKFTGWKACIFWDKHLKPLASLEELPSCTAWLHKALCPPEAPWSMPPLPTSPSSLEASFE